MYRQNLQQKMRELGISAEEIAGHQGSSARLARKEE